MGYLKLYSNPFTRTSYTRIYEVLSDTHQHTYDAIYKEVKEKPNGAYNRYLKEAEATILNKYSFKIGYDDMGDYYEKVQEYAVDRMQEQSLMYYQFVLMSLSNLYQVFEQQMRRWLHEEMTHQHNEYLNQNEGSGLEIPIVETEIWRTIRECNLISNPLKHGSGASAKMLYKLHPEYIEKIDETKLMKLYRTTHMEEVLNVDKIAFEKYATAMKKFGES